MVRPTVSVLMPVHNGYPYLEQAVDSILTQEFTDFEFLIVDDGSTDATPKLLSELADTRVRSIRTDRGGLVAALNLGLAHAGGEYVARMDSDDVARPARLGAQVERLQTSRHLGLVCSNVRVIDSDGRFQGTQRDNWQGVESLRDGLLYRRRMKPIIHPSVMMRHEVAVSLGGYRSYPSAEDRDFWLRALEHWGFERIQKDLLDYRIHTQGVSRQGGSEQAVSSALAALNALVIEQTGVDLYSQKPDLFEYCRSSLQRRIELEVAPAELAFIAARAYVRAGRWLRTAAAVSSGVARYGKNFHADAARRSTLRIIEDLASTMRETLASGGR